MKQLVLLLSCSIKAKNVLCEHKKTNGVNKNVVAIVSHNEYKDVLLHNISLSLSLNRIQSKLHRTETYEMNKNSLSCFDDKIYILKNAYIRLALDY